MPQTIIPCPCTGEPETPTDCPVCNDTRKLVVRVNDSGYGFVASVMDMDEFGPQGCGRTANQALQSLKAAIDEEYFS